MDLPARILASLFAPLLFARLHNHLPLKTMVCDRVEVSSPQEEIAHCMGVGRSFQRGGYTELYRGSSPDCHLNIVGCLLMHLSVSSPRGGGVGHRVGILTFSKKNCQNPHPWAKKNCQN